MLKKIALKLKKRIGQNHPTSKHCCNLCQSTFPTFTPFPIEALQELYDSKNLHNLYFVETLYLSKYFCPRCNSTDRERLMAEYISKNWKPSNSTKVLEIAPSQPLHRSLQSKFPNIRTCDLLMEGVDDNFDIQNLSGYTDETFDHIICSHVLEHIPNDLVAMMELHRVLKPRGEAIMIVPINDSINGVYENSAITTKKERIKHFGQNDHLRVYSSSGFIKRLEKAGFLVSKISAKTVFTDDLNLKGVHPRSALYIARK